MYVTTASYVTLSSVPIEVGYEFSVYSTPEGAGLVTLCAVVMNFPGGSPRPFTINATTEDGSAGTKHSPQQTKTPHFSSLFSLW